MKLYREVKVSGNIDVIGYFKKSGEGMDPEFCYFKEIPITKGEILGLMRKECLELGTFPKCESSLPHLAGAIISKLKGE